MQKKITSVLLSATLALSVKSIGQTVEVELDPITVTSTLQPLSVSKTGRNILVIKGEQFNKLPVNSIDELLRYVPGIEVQARGPMGAQSDIVMRGGTFQQVLVIIDGLRMNDPLSGHFNSYIPIAPAEIERIEVLKGASSAIYGSEAVGGVVHIITKSFAARQGAAQKGAGGQFSAGDYNLVNAQAGGHFSNGTTAIGGGLLTNNTSGQPLRGTKGYFNLATASLSGSHFINPALQLAVRSAFDDRSFSAQNYYTTFVSDTSTERVRSSWHQLSLSYKKGKNRFSIDGGVKTADDQFAFNSVVTPNRNKTVLTQLLARNDHQFATNLSLNTGLQYLNRGIRSNDRGNHNEDQLAGFALVHYQPAPRLTLSPAIRLDWNERRHFELVPQLSLGYRIKQLQLRGSLGKTIRDADFTERYNNFQKARVTSGRIGNPDLNAETSFNYEAGADYLTAKGFKIAGTFFQRYHKGLIDYVRTPYEDMPRKGNLVPGGTYALARNIANVNISGVEMDVQYTHTFNGTKSSLWSSAGVTWARARSADGNAVNAVYLSSFARLLTNFNLALNTPRFSLSANGLYKERTSQTATAIKAELSRSYFVLNSKAQVWVYQNKIALFTQVDNIFDKRYSDLLGAQMPGRWFMAGANFKL